MPVWVAICQQSHRISTAVEERRSLKLWLLVSKPEMQIADMQLEEPLGTHLGCMHYGSGRIEGRRSGVQTQIGLEVRTFQMLE